MEGSLLSPPLSKVAKVCSCRPPLLFSGPWQVTHFCWRMGAISLVKLTGADWAPPAGEGRSAGGKARIQANAKGHSLR